MVIAVIGAGSAGRRHAGNLTALGVPNVLIPYRTFDADKLIKQDINGVVIATATPIRKEIITLCADQDWPFYVEKPLGWTTEQIGDLFAIAAPVADRSMIGFMMRYHPALASLHATDLSQTYGFSFEIGHDVRQWRANWSFSDSYASDPLGGGVLLDLCHELDLAACLFPDLKVDSVTCLDHADFLKVDFATQISLSNTNSIGTVSMDYLNPVSTRRASLRGLHEKIDVDLLVPSITSQSDTKTFDFDRNTMFIAAMRDFVALSLGDPTSNNPLMPRFDRCRTSCDLIATAWEKRAFVGHVAHDMT